MLLVVCDVGAFQYEKSKKKGKQAKEKRSVLKSALLPSLFSKILRTLLVDVVVVVTTSLRSIFFPRRRYYTRVRITTSIFFASRRNSEKG